MNMDEVYKAKSIEFYKNLHVIDSTKELLEELNICKLDYVKYKHKGREKNREILEDLLNEMEAIRYILQMRKVLTEIFREGTQETFDEREGDVK